MPYVVNGIGTWYWGKSDIHGLKGVCEACGRSGELLSFDTRTFIVVFFVPVFPLGRKRILEQCPSCKRHRVIKYKDWLKLKNVSLPEAIDSYRSSPNDRDKAIEALQLCVACQDGQALDEVSAIASSAFANDADMQNLIGGTHAYFSRYESAESAFRASLAVKDDPEIRNALARNLLYQSRPDEAWELIAHDLQEESEMRGGLALLIAESYQTWGMHDAAQTVLDETIRVLPQLESDKDYKRLRKIATKYHGSDKKLKPKLLAPPKALKSQGRKSSGLVPVAIAALVIFGGMGLFAFSSWNAASHRKVHVVNGLSTPYNVSVNGDSHALPPQSHSVVEVAEGEVTVSVENTVVPIPDQTFHIGSTFFARLFDNDVHVINPDRAGVILWEEIEYTERGDEDSDYDYKLHAGEFHRVYSGIDYPFEEFPETVELPSGNPVHKTRIDVFNALGAPAVAMMLYRDANPKLAQEFISQKALLEPENVSAFGSALRLLPTEQSMSLLQKLTTIRPICIDAHRNYQNAMERIHPDVDLVGEYRNLLAEAPEDPDRIYLLGRITVDDDESYRLIEKAASCDPPSPQAIGALGYRHFTMGDFQQGTELYEKAVKLAPGNQPLLYYQMMILVAAERFDDAMKIYSMLDPWLIDAPYEDVYMAYRKGGRLELDSHVKKLLGQSMYRDDPESAKLLQANSDYIAAYVDGNIEQAIKASEPIEEPAMDFARAVMKGDLQAAAGLLMASERMETSHAIMLGVMLEDAGDLATANRLKDFAKGQLQKQGPDMKQVADWLYGDVTPDPEDVLNTRIVPSWKAVVLVAMAKQQPEYRERYLNLAEKLNFDRRFPHLTIKELIASSMHAADSATAE